MNKYLAMRIINYADSGGTDGLSYADVVAKYQTRKAGIDAELAFRGREDLIEK